MCGRMHFIRLVCGAVIIGSLAGCEAPSWSHKLNESFQAASSEESGPRTAEAHRREYASTRSRRSLHWLLAHEIQPGMTYRAVCNVIGEEGERELGDQSLKKTSAHIRIDDETYGWPDSEGHVLCLFFRDNRLINFDPRDFE